MHPQAGAQFRQTARTVVLRGVLATRFDVQVSRRVVILRFIEMVNHLVGAEFAADLALGNLAMLVRFAVSQNLPQVM